MVNNFYALPLSGWNGIFQGIGGGGYRAGNFERGANQTALGYSVGSTDAGHSDTASGKDASSWALASPGNVNQYLLLDFARLSIHDMTVIGKSLSGSFYERPVERSYWNGCSTGGRQGLSLAQYYPEDYDGILANAPAIQWNDFLLAQQWPFVVEINEGYTTPPCEFEFAAAAVVKACDGLDGLIDGIISAPALCKFQAQSLVGQTYVCGADGSAQTFSQKAATVVGKIWQGPQTPEGQVSWYGLVKGANFSSIAPNIAGNDTAQPFGITDSWIRNFIAKDVAFNTANVSYEEFAARADEMSDITHQGRLEYESIIGTGNPDLGRFNRRGGKMITWHGLADPIIPPQGSMFYYQKVLALDPSAADFYRQFYSPGVGHCNGGTGVLPTNALGQLRAWVENGTVPETLHAASPYPVNASSSLPVDPSKNVRFMDLCPWPAVEIYSGQGDPALAESWGCVGGTNWRSFLGINPKGRYSLVGGSN
ncbi:hypothetical protein SLS63_004221 [Diaporthe eres]|uniref:Carboxylic ester hydrolase n=1 Tax=Diaporthe eres TaxID=83184 RepID=A0ABR1PEJ3_DIAER